MVFYPISETDYHATPYDWNHHDHHNHPQTTVDLGTYLSTDELSSSTVCPTRSSVLGLAVTCALLVVVYVCTVFCVCIRRAVTRSKSATGGGPRDYVR